MEKFWTTKDGIIGTAHRSRDGKVVDFRPGEVEFQYNQPAFIVRPPKGQEKTIDLLWVGGEAIRRVAHTRLDDDIVEDTYEGTWEGVVLSASWRHYSASPQKAEEYRKKREAEEQERARGWEILATISEKEIASKILEHGGQKVVGKLRSGRADIGTLAKSAIHDLVAPHGEVGIMAWALEPLRGRDLEALEEAVFAEEAHLREERKKKFV